MQSVLNADSKESSKVYLFAYLNSFYESGFANPIDKAILNFGQIDISGFKKLDEVPYDFIRKRLSILVSKEKEEERIIITKGALINILDVCTTVETSKGLVDISQLRVEILSHFRNFSEKGFRVLGVCYKEVEEDVCQTRDEAGMTFLGFLTFCDPLKAGMTETIDTLERLGLSLKIITGDNRFIAAIWPNN